jgi:hypothetical protein
VGVIVFGFPVSWNVMLSQRDTSGHGNTQTPGDQLRESRTSRAAVRVVPASK